MPKSLSRLVASLLLIAAPAHAAEPKLRLAPILDVFYEQHSMGTVVGHAWYLRACDEQHVSTEVREISPKGSPQRFFAVAVFLKPTGKSCDSAVSREITHYSPDLPTGDEAIPSDFVAIYPVSNRQSAR